MANFAVIRKSDNVVVAVTPVSNIKMGDPETEQAGIDHLNAVFAFGCPYGQISDLYFRQCSFHAGGSEEKRYNYPGPGYSYSPISNAFIAPMPDSPACICDNNDKRKLIPDEGEWQLDVTTFTWKWYSYSNTSQNMMARSAAPVAIENNPISPENSSAASPEHQSFDPAFKPTQLPKTAWWKRLITWAKSFFKK